MSGSNNGKSAQKDIEATTDMVPASGAEHTAAPGSGLPLLWDSLRPPWRKC